MIFRLTLFIQFLVWWQIMQQQHAATLLRMQADQPVGSL
jgi:hypothetical protein